MNSKGNHETVFIPLVSLRVNVDFLNATWEHGDALVFWNDGSGNQYAGENFIFSDENGVSTIVIYTGRADYPMIEIRMPKEQRGGAT